MPDIFDDLKRITDQAWMFGKRLSKDDPLGPHDVADRLDKAAARVWRIILLAEDQGPEFSLAVRRSRYFTALWGLQEAIDRFLAEPGDSGEPEQQPPRVVDADVVPPPPPPPTGLDIWRR